MTPRENADSSQAEQSSESVRSSINVPPDLVVGLLGSADENLRALERILAAGCTDYIEKPIDPDLFMSQIEHYLSARPPEGADGP